MRIETRIKICGITRLQDAKLAADLGAWAVGFVFHPKSPRFVTPAEAGRISRALPMEMEKVGVFVNSSLPRMSESRKVAGLTLVQLHGDETPDLARRLGGRIIKAVRAAGPDDIDALSGFEVEALLVDGPGGGRPVKRELAVRAKKLGPVILAGGLGLENLAEARDAVAPWAFDLSSSLESAPGIKDPEKLRAFFACVRTLERSHYG